MFQKLPGDQLLQTGQSQDGANGLECDHHMGAILRSRLGEWRQSRLLGRPLGQPNHQRNLLDLHLFNVEEYAVIR